MPLPFSLLGLKAGDDLGSEHQWLLLNTTVFVSLPYLLLFNSLIFPLSLSLISLLGVEVLWWRWAARKEDEGPPGVEVSCGSVLRFSLGRGDSVREELLMSARRTEPGLEAGSLGGSGGGWCWSAIFIKISSLHNFTGDSSCPQSSLSL